jgi:drug/metabolite transporter (DMT)-like permease
MKVPIRPTLGHTAALVSVPITWGTFTPALKLLQEDSSPPAALLNVGVHGVGAVALLGLFAFQTASRPTQDPLPMNEVTTIEPQSVDAQGDANKRMRAVRASVELGLLLFLGQILWIVGLEGISATESAVLVESAVVLVPLFVRRPPDVPVWKHWGPSVIAMLGISLLVGIGGEPAVAEPLLSGNPQIGDASSSLAAATFDASTAAEAPMAVAISFLAAASFAGHTTRTGEYDDVGSTTQALGQILVATILDAVYLLASSLEATTTWLSSATWPQLYELLLVAGWCGVVICGFATWAQSYAQKVYSNTQAALAYALEPVFAAAFAAFVVDEHLGSLQAAGGALVVLANLVATNTEE